MARKKIREGPIGTGWVEEVKNDDGVRFVAHWNKFVSDPAATDGRRRVRGGFFELGKKEYHVEDGLTSLKKAETKWAKICDGVVGRSVDVHPLQKGENTFDHFTQHDPDGFRKRREQRWAGSTPEWFDYIMKKILARFGETKLKDIKERDLQAFLNSLADGDYSHSVVKNTRLYLRAVLAEAVEVGILHVSPAARLVMPRNTRKPQRPWLTKEQFLQIFTSTDKALDRIMMQILYLGGVRRGELFGLQWRDFDAEKGILYIERQILENLTVGPAKTDGSVAPIAIAGEIVAALIEWRRWAPNQKPDGRIFSSPRGAHINPSHWRKTVLLPAGKQLGIAKLNYQMFRRGFATEANGDGMNDKLIQGQMRYSSANTSRDIYMQTIPSAQHQAIERFTRVVVMPKKNA